MLNAKKNFVFNQTSNTEQLVGSKKFCKLAYNILITRQASMRQTNQDKWISDFQAYAVEKIDWSKIVKLNETYLMMIFILHCSHWIYITFVEVSDKDKIK